MKNLFSLILFSLLFPCLASAQEVTLTIDAPQTPSLLAVDDTFSVRTYVTQVFNVLRNDTRSDAELTTFEVVYDPEGILVKFNERGLDKVKYTRPENNPPGDIDQFAYRICNDAGECDTATATIYLCPEGKTGFPEMEQQLLRVDSLFRRKHPGQLVRFSTMPEHGSIEMRADSSGFTYKAHPRFTGKDVFKYDVYEPPMPVCGYTRIEGHQVEVQIMPRNKDNKPPIAVNDTVVMQAGQQKIDIKVLLNDSDPEGNLDPKILDVKNPPQGSVRYSPRSITYSPPKDYLGTVAFPYRVCDYNGACSGAKVVVLIKE